MAADDVNRSGPRRVRRWSTPALVLVALMTAPAAHATEGSDWLPLTGDDIEVGCTWDNGCVFNGVDGYHGAGQKALDLLVPSARPVFASGDGTVTETRGFCGPGIGAPPCNGAPDGRGNYVTISHGSHTSRYLHLSDVVVTGGEVKAGQLIGHTGTSGHDSIAHLHYDERIGTGKVDPGTLKACHGSSVVAYPEGGGGWPGYSAFTTNLRNDNYGCIAPPEPPKPPKPTCNAVTATVQQDTPAIVRLTCSGEIGSYSASAPAHGTLSGFDATGGVLTYTPAAGYAGPDSFTFAASNAGGEADRATVTLTVLPARPVCAAATVVVATGTPTPIRLSCSGLVAAYAPPSAPAHGTVAGFDVTAGTLTYTPAVGYTGPDAFTYTASNAGGDSAPASINVTVATPPLITRLRARFACVTSPRMRTVPAAGKRGLAFSFTLNQDAQVQYVLYRRDGSPARRSCPRGARGHTQDTFTPMGTITANAGSGDNDVTVASTRSARRRTARSMGASQRLRAGRHSVRLAAVTAGTALTPGTYVLHVTATNSLGQRSGPRAAKFFVLKLRAKAGPRSHLRRGG